MAEKFSNGQVAEGSLVIDVSGELADFNFDGALAKVFESLRSIDHEVDRTKPWDMVKRGEAAAPLVAGWVQRLRGVALALTPFMPQTARTIQEHLSAARITKAAPLFPRLS